jgi:GTP-binding protein
VNEARAPEEGDLETGRLLFAAECKFIWAAQSLGNLPPAGAPEIAFAGRSNVGKSSLINALTNRNSLARTSNTPGRTQQLNFFDLGNGRLTLVDLPGYGHAEASKTKIAEWTALTDAFLKGRVPLKRVCLLIDSRHGIKDSDRAAMRMLDASAVSYQVVLTKADKPTSAAVLATIEEVGKELKTHTAAHPEVMLTSAQEGTGIPELRARLAALAGAG